MSALTTVDTAFDTLLADDPSWGEHVNTIRRAAVEFLCTEWFGERCPDYEPECPTCKAWKELDDTGAFTV